MKILSTFILLVLSYQCFAQVASKSTFEPSLKYGKPSEEELKMTSYAPDTEATAIVLYSKNTARYELIANSFSLIYNFEVKIKVLKNDGTSYANIIIPYYNNESPSTMKEVINQIDASSYNLEDGKIVRTKMKRDLIFEERLNKKYKQIKFSIPAVREGTVFEYKYQLTSDFYYDINQWEAQKDIPVLNTQCDITIPEYFKFSLEMRGSQSLNPKDEPVNMSFNLQLDHGQMEKIDCTGRHLHFTGLNLPALRSDSYIWCPDDYRSGVHFELKGLDFPGSLYKSFTNTWADIDKMLLKDEDFGSLLKMRNPYREEMSTLELDKFKDRQEKITAIYTFLKNKISWNNQYSLYGNEVKKAIKNGTGSNAEINFILMSMLRDAQIPCYPVVMSRKNMGILPFTHPSIQKLNTFIVGIADTDSTFVFLDGSVVNGSINTLPPVLMVNRARLLMDDGGDNWIDLSTLGRNFVRSMVVAQIHPDGKITGNRQSIYAGQYAANFRSRYRTAKDSTDFINKLETEENIKVKDFQTKNAQNFSTNLSEKFTFEKQATINGNLIYINPLIFLHVSKSPFTQSERQLPIEMPFTDQLSLVISLTIPEGYVIDELPESKMITTEDRSGSCRYTISKRNNEINVTYVFSSNKLLFLADEYKAIKSFWELIANKNNEMLVLKKL